MTPRAYCGDACRARTRYRHPDIGDGWGTLRAKTAGRFCRDIGRTKSQRAAYMLPAAVGIREDRVRLARIGCCIGCGQTPAERASELATTGGAR